MIDDEQLNYTTSDPRSSKVSIAQIVYSILNESPDSKEKTNFHDYQETRRLMQVYIRPVIIIAGTVGNLMTFYVMQRGSMKKVSTCFYMAILALADTGKYSILLKLKHFRLQFSILW